MIDLHSHSDRSDGALSPGALIERAAARGVQVLALTDHDTVDGLGDALVAAKRCSIQLIPGVEISVTWSGRTLHVVGLAVDPGAAALRNGLLDIRSGRVQRGQAIGARLEKLGLPGAFDAAIGLSPNRDMVSRTHFARHMVAAGFVRDTGSAFRRYLGDGKPAHVRHRWADLREALDWIGQAGGVAVLAHPGRYGLRRSRLHALFAEFKSAGGVGVEVLTASHGPDEAAAVGRLAGECGLLASAGSDFHCPEESWLDLGELGAVPPGCQPVWDHPRLARLAALQ